MQQHATAFQNLSMPSQKGPPYIGGAPYSNPLMFPTSFHVPHDPLASDLGAAAPTSRRGLPPSRSADRGGGGVGGEPVGHAPLDEPWSRVKPGEASPVVFTRARSGRREAWRCARSTLHGIGNRCREKARGDARGLMGGQCRHIFQSHGVYGFLKQTKEENHRMDYSAVLLGDIRLLCARKRSKPQYRCV